MNTGAQMENRENRFARMAVRIYPAILMVAFVAVSSLIQTQKEKAWDSARTLTVSNVTEVANLRVVSFVETDTVLVFTHAPKGWFVPELKLHTIQYRLNPNGRALVIYHLTKPNGKAEVRAMNDDLLIDRRMLATALRLVETKAPASP